MSLKTKLKLVIITVFAVFTFAPSAPVAAGPSDCVDPVDKWYECWQQYRDIERYLNQWCSLAPFIKDDSGSSKNDRCKLTLVSQINFRPSGLASGARCNDFESAKEDKTCYANIRFDGSWNAALDDFADQCGFENPERDCRERVWLEFLEQNGWAPDGDEEQGLEAGNIENPQRTPFAERVATYIKWLMAGIGILGAFGLVIAGMQYAAAQGNGQAVADAKTRIVNVIIGILIYVTMFAMLQWLVPGGVF